MMIRFAARFGILSLLFLAGCGPRPFSVEEALWFHRATGPEFNGLETNGRERDIPPAIELSPEIYRQ